MNSYFELNLKIISHKGKLFKSHTISVYQSRLDLCRRLQPQMMQINYPLTQTMSALTSVVILDLKPNETNRALFYVIKTIPK